MTKLKVFVMNSRIVLSNVYIMHTIIFCQPRKHLIYEFNSFLTNIRFEKFD
jgi:hypothetical protein